MKSLILLVVCGIIATASAHSWPTTVPAAGQSVRVSGNQSPANKTGDIWYWNDLKTESPLPVGYNAPTPDGAIEIKTYPTVRRAEVDSDKIFLKDVFGINRAFWILFEHIKSRNIAMTAPVEFNFRNFGSSGKFLESDDVEWVMSFLYRTPDLGDVGTDGDVVIVDKPETTVISIGLEGGFSFELLNKGVKHLNKALSSQSTWVAAGEPRFFSYNDPMKWYKWAEV